jgi:hypothetical protein
MITFKQEQTIVAGDSVRQKSDTSLQNLSIPSDSGRIVDSIPHKKISIPDAIETQEPVDTTSVCIRNSISDVTFYDSLNIITRIDQTYSGQFPFLFTEKNRIRESEAREKQFMLLKNGKEIPSKPFHNDWIIIIILISAFLYAVISTFAGRFFRELKKFYLIRGIGDPSSRDTGELFHWPSTIFNLVSFVSLALFFYCAVYYFNSIPSEITGIIFWLIALGIIIIAVSSRHIICFITGRVSGQNEAFNEYILTIYLFYRFMALILFILTILLIYTTFLPAKSLFYAGFFIMALLFILRIIRLFIIFLKRNISILYLILYLCALEFLPAVVLVKYFRGLF